MVVIASKLGFSFPAFGVVLRKGENRLDSVPPALLERLAVYVRSGHVEISGLEPAPEPPTEHAPPEPDPEGPRAAGSSDEPARSKRPKKKRGA